MYRSCVDFGNSYFRIRKWHVRADFDGGVFPGDGNTVLADFGNVFSGIETFGQDQKAYDDD